jgi:hypothetical protein
VIRMMVTTDAGPVIVLGIIESNVRLMREGRPLHLDLAQFTKEAYAEHANELPEKGSLHLMIYYGQTHRAILEQLRDELAPQGHTIAAAQFAAAEQLDAQLREEGRL